VVNARDVKRLPGRPKTDRLDAVWLCKVAERQMIRPSFVPPPPIRALRDLSDLFGVSGRAMMAALIGGQRDPRVLAQLAKASLRRKITMLEEAFIGRFTDHHGFLLDRIDAIAADIADVHAQIEAHLVPFVDAATRLVEIPGVGAAALGPSRFTGAVGRAVRRTVGYRSLDFFGYAVHDGYNVTEVEGRP
jgi:transposase